MTLGQELPNIRSEVPGIKARSFIDQLAQTECPALTARRARRSEASGANHDPIVWTKAQGVNVYDVDGNRYVDLSSGFGASSIGHAHPDLVASIQEQSQTLLHALGDLHPSDVKIELLQRLQELSPFPDARVILSLSGSDAIESALKTAQLHTSKAGVIAFKHGYHGLEYAALAVSGYNDDFKAPFQSQLASNIRFAEWPLPKVDLAECTANIEALIDSSIGAILVEPILGRGGIRIPPPGFLNALRELCDKHELLLVVDEILTGLGRTGSLFRVEAENVLPDILCIGKTLGGGLPISACIGKANVMQSWTRTNPDGGEAIHTGTFFGNPLAARAALSTLDILEREQLAERSANIGQTFLEKLESLQLPGCVDIRGAGMLLGLEVEAGLNVLNLTQNLLRHGYITLPAGPNAEVLELLPPLTIERSILDHFCQTLETCWQESFQ